MQRSSLPLTFKGSNVTSANSRQTEYQTSDIFLNRWSPRAFTGEEIPQQTLLTLLDAAHWAPSAYNFQPWRFIYARRGTAHWDRLLGVLGDFNRSWAKAAAAVVVVLSKKADVPPGQSAEVPNSTHSFDAGTAWGYLALQASLLGWHAHGMSGIDREKARVDLGVPDGYAVEMALVIGRVGDKSTLPEPMRARETPSGRKSLAEVAAEGKFSF
jgi:nitroreductase